MRKPKLRELGEALKVLFVRGPYTTRFPAEPYIAPDTYRGVPRYDDDQCIGCGACARVCPARAIEVIDDPATRRRTLRLNYDICIFCGQCHAYCTTSDGINQTNEYDLATLDRAETKETVEKELVLCEHCGSVIGARDHLRWLFDRLGAQAYANPTLILAGSLGTGAPDHSPPGMPPPGMRSDLMRLLCPKCRRDTFLLEEWK